MSPFASVDRTWLVGRLLITVVALPVCAGSVVWILDPNSDLHLLLAALATIAGISLTAWAGAWLDGWCAMQAREIARRWGVRVPERWQ